MVMHLLSALARAALTLVLIAVAAVFALGLLAVALLSLAGVLLQALLTGRKPGFVITIQRFNQVRRQFQRGGFAAQFGDRFGDRYGAGGPSTTGGFAPSASGADVVDVQAHEVRHTPALPDARGADKA